MKKVGIGLMLAGISLIVVLFIDIMSQDRSIIEVRKGTASREVSILRWFAAVGTVLVITGVGATVLDRKH